MGRMAEIVASLDSRPMAEICAEADAVNRMCHATALELVRAKEMRDEQIEDELQQAYEDERAALRRVAANSSLADAVLLAGSLGHADLFIPQEPTTYGYMGEER